MLRKLFLVDKHVCPWWLAYSFDNPVRPLLHKPQRILAGLVNEGQTVADIGCGMGHFTLGMAQMVGTTGRVIAVDLQEKMLERVQQRAIMANLFSRIQCHPCQPDRLNLPVPIDFALAFWMVHEVPDARQFLQEIQEMLRPGGQLLIAEPKLHVSHAAFQQTIDIAQAVGYRCMAAPPVRFSYAALLSV